MIILSSVICQNIEPHNKLIITNNDYTIKCDLSEYRTPQQVDNNKIMIILSSVICQNIEPHNKLIITNNDYTIKCDLSEYRTPQQVDNNK